MKFPNHIIMDFKTVNLNDSNRYWIFKYIFSFKPDFCLYESFLLPNSFLMKKNFNNFANQNKFTLKYSLTNVFFFASEAEKKFAIKFFSPRPKVKRKVKYSKFKLNIIYNFNREQHNIIDYKFLFLLLKNFKSKKQTSINKSFLLWTLFDINFLRKEKMYTKLKYSRVPQYDIVSGGAAALFSGFLGFLICEKFGFELIDSGDFYILFMYVVFLSFSLRPFLRITAKERLAWNAFSYKWLLTFYRTLVILTFNKIKN